MQELHLYHILLFRITKDRMECVEKLKIKDIIIFSLLKTSDQAAVGACANAKVRRPAHRAGLHTLLAFSFQANNISVKIQTSP